MPASVFFPSFPFRIGIADIGPFYYECVEFYASYLLTIWVNKVMFAHAPELFICCRFL